MHNLVHAVHAKAVYDGTPTSDDSSDGTFVEFAIGPENPRMLFIVHGIKQADTSDSTMQWQVYGSNCDSPDFGDYDAISGATHGIVTVLDSAAASVYGPYMLDVDCRAYARVAINIYSSDATALETHVVALGYGGIVGAAESSDIVLV